MLFNLYANNNDSALILGVVYLCYVNNNDSTMTLGLTFVMSVIMTVH